MGEVEELQKQIENLKNSNAKFISNLAHELRTPINAVIGRNEMILRECKDPQILEYAADIQTAGKTLEILINDIIDMASIDEGTMELTMSTYSLKEMISKLWGLVYMKTKEKGLELHLHLDKNTPDKLYGDETRITQVVKNLLNNAVKYTQKGRIDLYIKFKEKSEDTIILYIMVVDTGIGIKEEDLELATMNANASLVEHMGGKFTVESQYEKGSTFTAIIPQKVTDKTPIGEIGLSEVTNGVGEKPRARGNSALYAPNAKILIVDDNALNLKVVSDLLKRTKIQVTTADSGEKALEICQTIDFDIIFMDHQMPGMDGLETIAKLKETDKFKEKEVPLVMFTANAINMYINEYENAGIKNILPKPVDPVKLETIIARLLPSDLLEEAPRKEAVDKDTLKQQMMDRDAMRSWLAKHDIDLDEGLKYTGNDIDSYSEIAATFVEVSGDVVNKLRTFIANKDAQNYGIEMHALKGNAATLGAKRLSLVAKKLEAKAKVDQMDTLAKAQPALEDMIKVALEGLSAVGRGKSEGGMNFDEAARANLKKVLALDDSAVIIKSLELSLKDKYNVKGFTRVIDAMKQMNLEKPDIIILDIDMPEKNGLDVLSDIRKTPKLKDVPVIMLTASTDKQNVVESIKRGANDYSVKPLDDAALVAKIESFIK